MTVHPEYEVTGLNEPVSFSIIKCAQEHCQSNKAIESSVRSYYSFHLITHGSGVIEKDGIKRTLQKGTCFLLSMGESYKYYPVATDPWSYIYIDFYIDKTEILERCGFSKNQFWLKCETDRLHELLVHMLEAFRERPFRPFECEGCFLMLLSMLISERKRDGAKRGDRRSIAEEAMIFINNNYRLPLAVDDIASALGYSASYITSSMTKAFGWTPVQYLTIFRIATACELIQAGGRQLKDIAAAVGYSDPLYFSRAFSKVKGMGPREYKNTLAATDKPFSFLAEKNIDFR